MIKSKKADVLKNASQFYNKWIDMYEKECEQIYERKCEDWKKSMTMKILKNFETMQTK